MKIDRKLAWERVKRFLDDDDDEEEEDEEEKDEAEKTSKSGLYSCNYCAKIFHRE